ncbi:hypothetical protein J437_LFUL003614 [Ladona fulva]|uniref:PiggyBac transposable element-derived protein domain-containing protein n=1 Tax=Ladona fulva TaxID=123851 RepID=A0A8K0KK38_LADFU|nr:hypothetical protein J437_LFUL003614 [Ladona fulva]
MKKAPLKPMGGQEGKKLYDFSCPSSPDLCQRLVQRTTDAVGTVKITFKGIPTILKKKLKKGEVVRAKCGKLVALKWRDKRNNAGYKTFQ